jgi:hypothetical protein
MRVDVSKWSGEGAFTQVLIDRLRLIDAVALVRVEDAPASRSEADYNFISNEIFVAFATRSVSEKQEHAPSGPALPAKTRAIRSLIARVARLLGARSALVGRAPSDREERVTRFGFLPSRRTVAEKVMTIPGLEQAFTSSPGIGAPDYADAGMMQYLRTERIIPPYQTRGYKLVELVRIYEVGAERREPGRP